MKIYEYLMCICWLFFSKANVKCPHIVRRRRASHVLCRLKRRQHADFILNSLLRFNIHGHLSIYPFDSVYSPTFDLLISNLPNSVTYFVLYSTFRFNDGIPQRPLVILAKNSVRCCIGTRTNEWCEQKCRMIDGRIASQNPRSHFQNPRVIGD